MARHRSSAPTTSLESLAAENISPICPPTSEIGNNITSLKRSEDITSPVRATGTIPPAGGIAPLRLPNTVTRLENAIGEAERIIKDKAYNLPSKGIQKCPIKSATIGSGQIGYYIKFAYCTVWAVPDLENKNLLAFEIHGAIRDQYERVGQAISPLGALDSDQIEGQDGIGRYNRFRHGVIYWTPKTGAQDVHGEIFQYWKAIGSERSWLGYPVSGEQNFVGDGREARQCRLNSFEHGQLIKWTDKLAIQYLNFTEAILKKYNELGGICSSLGMPLVNFMPAPLGIDIKSPYVSFRGGNLGIPWQRPYITAAVNRKVRISWVGVECKVKLNDKLAGVLSILVPSLGTAPMTIPLSIRVGPIARVMKLNKLLYAGPPANVIITTTSVDSNTIADSHTIFDIIYYAYTPIVSFRGNDVSGAFDRENELLAAQYKELQTAIVFRQLQAEVRCPDYPAHPGFLEIKWDDMTEQGLQKRELRKNDYDRYPIRWTHSFEVRAWDTASGRMSSYQFYFNIEEVLDRIVYL